MKNRYKKYSFVIATIPFLAWTIPYFTQSYRFSDCRSFYLGGVIAIYTCWIISIFWGIINAIELYRENLKLKEKMVFIFISLLPTLLILTLLASIL